jgi:TolB-like protein/Tfp pilus assembly protein PilF
MGGWWISKPQSEAPPAKQPAVVTAPVSEARRLARQAQVVFSKTEVGPGELDAAAVLCERAVALDSSDAEAWATFSEVEIWRVLFGGDPTPERQESARTKAVRALNLDPHLFEARRAQACYQVSVGPRVEREAEATLRALRSERPKDRQTLLMLGILLRQAQKIEEAVACFEELAVLPGSAARACSEIAWAWMVAVRRDESNAAADRSIAAQPFTGNVALKVYLAQSWLGDLDLARATLAKLPASTWLEDRALATAIRVFRWGQQPDQILGLLKDVPRDWIAWSFHGPKAAVMGDAYEKLNQPLLARNEWKKALGQVEQRLVGNSNDWKLNVWKAYLLAALGERTASDAALRLAKESAGGAAPVMRWISGQPALVMSYNFVPRLSSPEEIIADLERRAADPAEGLAPADLRNNPSLEEARALPRFRALLVRMESDPRFPPQGAAAKPKMAVAADAKSVAVLAFKNLSDDRDTEYFSDGVSEELGNVLGRVPGLRVAASTSAFSFKGKAVPVAEIARQLGVAYVVEGTVRKMGTTLRINAKLVQAADGFQVWSSGNLEREVKNVFALQDEIAGLIAQALSLRLGIGASGQREEVDPDAFRWYIEGRREWNRRNPEGYARAENLLIRAIEKSPRFARAPAALADVWELQGEWDNTIGPFEARDSAQVRRIRAKIGEALALDPQCAEAHASLGLLGWNTWQPVESEAALRAAIRINPNYASAHQWLGRNLMMQGRYDEARSALQLAAELDPLSPRILDNLAWARSHAGATDEALTLVDRALALQPDAVQPTSIKARILAQQGRRAEALGLLQTLSAGVWISSHWRAMALAQIGGPEARSALEALRDDRNAVTRFAAMLGLGRRDEALDSLVPGAIESTRADVLLFDPTFDPVRGDPRFRRALDAIGLTEAHARAQAWRAANPPEKPKPAAKP